MSKKQRFPSLIVFFGPDGAGKSMQASLLTRHLRSKNYHTLCVWIRGRHTLAFVFSKFFSRLGYYQIVKRCGAVHRVFDINLLPGLQLLWGLIEFISVLPWIITKIYLPRIFGYIVVADRYVIDTTVYLGYWLGPDFFRGHLSRILLSFIPRDSILIHLDAETSVLMERIRYDPVTQDFVEFQRKVYRILAKVLRAETIDTSMLGIKETFERIINLLTTRCN